MCVCVEGGSWCVCVDASAPGAHLRVEMEGGGGGKVMATEEENEETK